jgi:hypothetical protein
MKYADVLHRLQDRPFRPFRIHLSEGSIVAIDDPGMIIVGKSSMVVPTSFTRDEEGLRLAKHWRTIAINHIVQFTELNEPMNGSKRKKKS